MASFALLVPLTRATEGQVVGYKHEQGRSTLGAVLAGGAEVIAQHGQHPSRDTE